MFSLLKRLSTVPTLLATLAVSGPLYLLILLHIPDKLARAMGYKGEPSVFALDGHPYTPEATYELLTDYGETGRRATILMHLLFDVILPVSYTLFYSISFTLLGRSISFFSRLWRWAVVLSWLAGGSDLLVENSGIILMARLYPARSPLLARLTSMATAFKWEALALTELLWLAGGLLWLLQRLRGQTNQRVGTSSLTVSK
jgi:hypothetical protein